MNSSQPATEIAPGKSDRVRPWALLLLFSAIHFAIVALLLIAVLNEVSGGYAKQPPASLSAIQPKVWETVFNSYLYWSAPNHLLDQFARAADIHLYRWAETQRFVVQCGFCGLVWGALTYLVYWSGCQIARAFRRAGDEMVAARLSGPKTTVTP